MIRYRAKPKYGFQYLAGENNDKRKEFRFELNQIKSNRLILIFSNQLSLLIASCLLAVSSLKAVYGYEQANSLDSLRVSYNRQALNPNQQQQQQQGTRLTTDLAVAANLPSSSLMMSSNVNSDINNNHFRQTQMQPSIYHSIIDRSTASTQLASPVQATTATLGDLNTAAGHHHGHAHGKYYEYREVPKKKTWKFGYKRGNHKHTIERHEHGKAGKHPHFKTKVKWHDKKSKGKGIHLWDYNHHDKKHYHHG